MSITDELRKFAWKECPSKFLERVIGIADDIDKKHESVCCEIADKFDGWVIPPKDADGVPIHIGDYLHSDENGKDFPCRGFALTLVRGANKWWTVECCYDAYSGTAEFVSAKSCHHTKPDSWERIISEFAERVLRSGHQWGLDAPATTTEFVERCKRLAGEDA